MLLAGEVESIPLQFSVFDSAEERERMVIFLDTRFQAKVCK